jgi:hypothetical protein
MSVNAYPATINVFLADVINDFYLVIKRCYASLGST